MGLGVGRDRRYAQSDGWVSAGFKPAEGLKNPNEGLAGSGARGATRPTLDWTSTSFSHLTLHETKMHLLEAWPEILTFNTRTSSLIFGQSTIDYESLTIPISVPTAFSVCEPTVV